MRYRRTNPDNWSSDKLFVTLINRDGASVAVCPTLRMREKYL